MVNISLDEKKDYATQLVHFIQSMEGELATQVNLDRVEMKKQEFADWLKSNWLYDLVTNPLVCKSEFEWECAKFINSIFEMFDSTIHKFYSADPSITTHEVIRRRNYVTCTRMMELCKDFEDRLDEFSSIR